MVKEKETSVKKAKSGGSKDEVEVKRSRRTERKLSSSRSTDKSPSRGRPRKTDSSPSAKTKVPKTPKKTPSKPTTRSRSPGRKSIHPAVPIKKVKEPAPVRPEVIAIESESDSESDTVTTSSVITRSRRTLSKEPSSDIVNNLRSRVRRDNSDLFLRTAYEPVKKLTEFSDEDEREPAKQTLKPKISVRVWAAVATLLYCFAELSLTYLVPVLCNETHCEYRIPTRKDLTKILESLDLSIFFTFASFVLFNGILSIIPIGGKKYASLLPRDGKFEYNLNALSALVLQIIIMITLEVYHIPVTSHIVKNYFALITSAVLVSLALGVILFIKSLYTKKEKLLYDEQNHLDNFIMGAEVNPRLGPMDVKFVAVRTCTIGVVLIVLAHVFQSMEMISTPPMDAKSASASAWTLNLIQSIRIKPTLSVLSTLIVIYFADQFFFESGLLSTMEFKTIPWGFLKCNEYLSGLFIFAAIPKYVYDYNVQLQSWELLLCTIIFLVGYALYRGANSQKHAFRENPYSSVVSRYESIPSTTGKKILCSGYWGFVRHPNYLGDIILNLALVRFVWPSPLLLIFVFIIGHLLVRAYVDNKQCKQRYGVAWERYCQRVPYLLVPKVF